MQDSYGDWEPITVAGATRKKEAAMQDDLVERVARALCRFDYRQLESRYPVNKVVDETWPRYADKARAAMAATREIDAEALMNPQSEVEFACREDAARLQERHERFAHASDDDGPRVPRVNVLERARAGAALMALLGHYAYNEAVATLNDDVANQVCIDGKELDWHVCGDAFEALLNDYAGNPQAAVTYLQTLLAPSQPVNRGLLGQTASDVMVSL